MLEPSKRKVDTSDWVVILHQDNLNKQHYDVRLTKTVDKAITMYGKAARQQFIYASALELERRLTSFHLKEHLKKLTRQFSVHNNRYRQSVIMLGSVKMELTPDSAEKLIADGERDALALGLWNLCHLIGDPIYGSPDSPEVEGKFRIRLDLLTGPGYETTLREFPKQARTILEGLIENAEEVMDEDEMHKFIRRLGQSGRLKTRQDPVLVWKFYAPMLGDKGLVYYPGKRHKREDHDEQMAGL